MEHGITDFEKVKKEFIKNFSVITDLEYFPLDRELCIFCINSKLFHDKSCSTCWYGKHHGICQEKTSSFSKLWNAVKNFILKGNSLGGRYYILFNHCRNVNEIMNCKKSLLFECLDIIEREKSIEFENIDFFKIKKLIEDYWIDESENEKSTQIKISKSDLTIDKYNKAIEFGYDDGEIIANLEPKFVKFGQKIKIHNHGIFYLIRFPVNSVTLINENFKDYSGTYINNMFDDKVHIEDLEKLINLIDGNNHRYELID